MMLVLYTPIFRGREGMQGMEVQKMLPHVLFICELNMSQNGYPIGPK